MLDDHILKAQTMHSSAYIKPFEQEMKEWEEKLISMQVLYSTTWNYEHFEDSILRPHPSCRGKIGALHFDCVAIFLKTLKGEISDNPLPSISIP